MEAALDTDVPSLALVAPSGYGKTSLLEQYEQTVGAPGTVRIDLLQCCNHPGLFIDHLVKGLLRWDPEATVKPILSVKRAVTTADYVDGLTLACKRVSKDRKWTRINWILDRVDSVDTDSAVDSLVKSLLQERPPQVSVKVVAASRSAAPSFLQDGTVWSQTELRLTGEEIEALFLNRGLEAPDSEVLALLEAQTEGWPAAVNLYADILCQMTTGDWAPYLSGLPTEGGVGSRLAMSLMEHLASPVRYFATTISVLDEVTSAGVQALFLPSEGENGGLVALPKDKLNIYREELVASRLLAPSNGEWRLHPLFRNALRQSLKDRNPEGYRELNRRAAKHQLAQEAPVHTNALQHLYEAEDYDEFMELLKGSSAQLLRLGHQRKLGNWLDGLADKLQELPIWANYELANIHSLRGNWDLTREYLERCRASLKERNEPDDVLWLPKINAAYAVMCARRGWVADARTYCRRGLDYIRQVRRRQELEPEIERELILLQLRLLDRLATNKYSAGLLSKAWDVCTEAREIALGTGDRAFECKALSKLGTVAHVKGSLAVAEESLLQAYNIACELNDPVQRVEAEYGLGWNYLDMGEFGEAEKYLVAGEAGAAALGHTALLWRVRTTLGVLRFLENKTKEAKIAFRAGYELADSIGNLGLRGEMLDWYALFLARIGEIDRAREIFEEAHELIGGKLRTQQPLAALHREVEAELLLAEGRVESAVRAYTSVAVQYDAMGAKMALIRAHWRLAEIEHMLFSDDRRSSPDDVFENLGVAMDLAAEARAALPLRPEHRELVEVGYRFGGPVVTRMSEDILVNQYGADLAAVDERWSIKVDDEFHDDYEPSVVERYRLSEKQTGELAAYWSVTRDSEKTLTEEELQTTLDDQKGRVLMVLLHEQHLDNFKSTVSLAQKRVILPLLVHFLRNHEEEFTMAELAQYVWKADSLDNSMRTKVKVAISRLRSLLGKRRKYIVTGRRGGEGRRGDVTYKLSPRIDFQLIGHVGDEYCPDDLLTA